MKKLYSLLFSLISAALFAQTYTFTTFNTSNSGINSNNVNDVKQASNGTLWIATGSGLSAMSGNNFTNYTMNNSAIGVHAVVKLAVSGNNVWGTTYQEGLVYRNGTTGAFSRYTTSNSGLPNNVINDIATDAQGTVWIASSSGLTRFNGSTWTTYSSSNSQLGSNDVTSVAVDASNNVWVSAGSLLFKFSNNNFTTITDGVVSIYKITAAGMYVNTGDGLGKIVNNAFTNQYWTSNSCLASCNVTAVGLDETSKVWLGLDNCGNYAGGVQNFTNCTTYTTSNSALPHNSITSLHVISSNVIWAGTVEGGLVRMNKTDASVCAPPTGLNVPERGQNYAMLDWASANPAPGQGYVYRYSTVNNISGATGSSTSETSAGIDQLQPNTTYYWWVASACEPLTWVSGGSFTTLAAPACAAPTGLNVAQFGQTTAYLAWTAASPAPANGYMYRYNTVNNVTGALGNSTSQTGVGIDQLQPNTTYYWWVASACEPVTWVPGGSFTTQPSPVCFVQVAAGANHSLGIKADGTLWAWGSNDKGQLGTGTGNQNQPKQVGTDTNWKSIAAGLEHSMAVKTNGTLWGWGSNGDGRLGTGGSQSTNVTQPVQVGTATNWASVCAGERHTIALKTNGTIWGWGLNNFGQVGDNTTITKNTPVQIGTATTWTNIYVGAYHSFGLQSNGGLYGWGLNLYGQLGDGSNTNRSAPVPTALNGIQSFATGGFHSMAVRTTGALYTWGNNEAGQLGDGTINNKNVPAQVGTVTTWKSVAAGDQHSMAIRTNGALYTWGSNNKGQLGLGSTANEFTPAYVGSMNWTAVTGGYYHTIAIRDQGQGLLYGWGSNVSGQAGGIAFSQATIPTSVACPQSALAISDFNGVSDVKTYPNPVIDVLNISHDKNIESISIYNLLGQQVFSKSFNASEVAVNLSELQSGTYFVKITSGSEVKTTKIIKK